MKRLIVSLLILATALCGGCARAPAQSAAPEMRTLTEAIARFGGPAALLRLQDDNYVATWERDRSYTVPGYFTFTYVAVSGPRGVYYTPVQQWIPPQRVALYCLLIVAADDGQNILNERWEGNDCDAMARGDNSVPYFWNYPYGAPGFFMSPGFMYWR